MLFTKEIIDKLSQQAKESPRLRANLDLRNSSEDNSQRMLNALEPGTILPIHRHKDTSETLVMVRGRILQKMYDENGILTDEFVMGTGVLNSVLQIPAGQFHSLECLEEGTVIFEAKDGKYAPLSDIDILNC